MSIFLGLLTCPCSDFCPKWWVLSPSKDPCIVTSSARKSLVRLWTPWIFHQIWVVIAVNKSNKFSQFLPTNPSVAEFSNPLSFLDKFGRFAPPPLGSYNEGCANVGVNPTSLPQKESPSTMPLYKEQSVRSECPSRSSRLSWVYCSALLGVRDSFSSLWPELSSPASGFHVGGRGSRHFTGPMI